MAEINIKKINELAKAPSEMIAQADAEYEEFVSSLADRISTSDRIRVVLLAGPSGSGKTTTANMLADAVKARGGDCMVVSLDDFYRDATDPEYPRLENGERDFERPEALNLPELEEVLCDIAEGRDFYIPRYDFKIGSRREVVKYSKMLHGCVVIEGLHALNPKICASIPRDKVLKIFISVSTNVNKNGKRILSGRKIRFLRRMVRDNLYRAADAELTLKLWPNVLHGEDAYLYPYRDLADVHFNTFHSFELGVMRQFCERLISDGLARKDSYAKTVLSAVRQATPIDEKLVPESSLIREFIPGGMYDHLY